MIAFEIVARDVRSAARCGRLSTPHGVVETPAFMPVGTAATVKGLTPEQVRAVGTQVILANTYHLALRPGAEAVAELGGLHVFSGWDGPILTDSGGFQVFSLGELVRVDEDGVSFRSHVDGARLRLDPESATRVQNLLGADIIMAFDQCVPAAASRDEAEAATQRSIRWAQRCKQAHRREDQLLFGIVQGGLFADLRRGCAEALCEMDFPGYAVGGLALGESIEQRDEVLRDTAPYLPDERPRYLMGVGRPVDILHAVSRGIDLFDCVLPTRNGRNSHCFTSVGVVRLRNSAHARSREPLDPACACYTCRHFSRGYLRHLFLADEMLGPILASLHNIAYYQAWMKRIRAAISDGTLIEWMNSVDRI
ncbi:MAG: tRNA guanosine(34) transglycosylase Tgt [Phycisphaerae bacterium]|nr:tRNA guanosine(34) transglycosylase Tgt [Phycisphaerae bacterium]NUQ45065.1 tRNA guanosine(34) transglycosylase Tgt [Phycisphaerae bacterium]